jgi:LemA protein
VGRYNSLVRAEETVDQSWAQVENVLQRRADLIPNLVETVKGFAAHEQQVFGDIAEARSKLLGATGPTQAAQANAQMESALGRLLAIAENYPDLKSNQNFIRLQDELAGTENRIAVERKRYNDAVAEFNKTIKTFPNNIVAGMLGFDAHAYFEVEEQAKEVPKVEF